MAEARPLSARQRGFVGAKAEDCAPPSGLQTFYVRLRLGGQRWGPQHAVGGLSDEVLAWVARTVAAEQDRRADPVPVKPSRVMQYEDKLFVLVPEDGLQFVMPLFQV